MNSCLQDTKPKIIYDPVFLYFDNILDKDLFTNLRKWLDKLDYKNGYSMEGKLIPRQQIWFQVKGAKKTSTGDVGACWFFKEQCAQIGFDCFLDSLCTSRSG